MAVDEGLFTLSTTVRYALDVRAKRGDRPAAVAVTPQSGGRNAPRAILLSLLLSTVRLSSRGRRGDRSSLGRGNSVRVQHHGVDDRLDV